MPSTPRPVPTAISSRRRVAVALSGGVDSSVAAALLLEQGYRVEGITLRLWRDGPSLSGAPEAAARRVCRALGIPHRVLDLEQQFLMNVVEHWSREYARGRTPNPCIRCNRLIKFGLLLSYVRAEGFQALATGHYARIAQRDGRLCLQKAQDQSKDQSYFLYALGQDELSALSFPLGDLSKTQVREMAKRLHLPVADRPESQDICFISGGNHCQFVRERLPQASLPGPIYDTTGRLLGEHRGLVYYTVGQRSGLRISAPRPLYVMALDAERNALVVGYAEELGYTALEAEEMAYVSGDEPPAGIAVEAMIRYRGRPEPARLWPLGEATARVVFDHKLRDIAPGQSVVIYQGSEVLGGGVIARALPLRQAAA